MEFRKRTNKLIATTSLTILSICGRQLYDPGNAHHHQRYRLPVTATVPITILDNCYIVVPTAFTPNNDGLNDFLYPLNAYKARDLSFAFTTALANAYSLPNDWTNKWDGRYKGQDADMSTYLDTHLPLIEQ